jgi:hypothetical protein
MTLLIMSKVMPRKGPGSLEGDKARLVYNSNLGQDQAGPQFIRRIPTELYFQMSFENQSSEGAIVVNSEADTLVDQPQDAYAVRSPTSY